ncbi:hypothetical protein MKW92_008547 [Papaver armeniacum]|nr:hypothetical protein MKW92_008547 [Papaver armeniacum]
MDLIRDVTQRGVVKSLRRILAANPGFSLAYPKFTSFLRTPLHVAAMHGYVEFASEILRIHPLLAIEVDSQGLTPLHLASTRNNVTIVGALLNANSDACLVRDHKGRTPLHLAAMRNEIKVMELLIESRPESIHQVLPKTDETILQLCVKQGNLKAMEMLVDYLVTNKENPNNPDDMISVNSIDIDGNTILHLAAKEKQTKILKYLLGSDDIRVDINILNNDGVRALDMLDKNEMDDIEFGCDHTAATKEVRQHNTTSKNEWLKERLNSIMIVAALIAGVAFQSVINPPGGVFQEDSKIDSITDPVMFTYYLRNIIDNHAMSEGFQSYYLHTLPQKTARGNITAHDEIMTHRANFVKDLLTAAKTSESLTRSVLPYTSQKSAPGIVLDDDWWMNITSNYNTTMGGGSGFSPYLIRYAGTAVLAYTSPKAYESYILLNSFSLAVCAMAILVVTFDAIKNRPPGRFATPRVVYLEVLVAIAVACISISYTIVITTISPPFYQYFTLDMKLLILSLGFTIIPIICLTNLLISHIPRRMLPKRCFFSRLWQCALDQPFLKRLSYRNESGFIWLIAKVFLVYIVFAGLLYF